MWKGYYHESGNEYKSISKSNTAPQTHHSHHEAGPERLVKVRGKMNAAKYKEILEDNLIKSTRVVWLGRRFFFPPARQLS